MHMVRETLWLKSMDDSGRIRPQHDSDLHDDANLEVDVAERDRVSGQPRLLIYKRIDIPVDSAVSKSDVP